MEVMVDEEAFYLFPAGSMARKYRVYSPSPGPPKRQLNQPLKTVTDTKVPKNNEPLSIIVLRFCMLTDIRLAHDGCPRTQFFEVIGIPNSILILHSRLI